MITCSSTILLSCPLNKYPGIPNYSSHCTVCPIRYIQNLDQSSRCGIKTCRVEMQTKTHKNAVLLDCSIVSSPPPVPFSELHIRHNYAQLFFAQRNSQKETHGGNHYFFFFEFHSPTFWNEEQRNFFSPRSRSDGIFA